MEIFKPGLQIRFGQKDCDLNFLKTHHPTIRWIKLRQTHSDIFRVASAAEDPSGLEGDALITYEKGIGLAISTADCLPVMALQPESGWIAAIHSGWRGVAKQIVPKTLQHIRSLSNRNNFEVWIGPHIQGESFEVGSDVQNEILRSIRSAEVQKAATRQLSPDKAILNLAAIVTQQIREAELSLDSCWSASIDTKTSSSFNSHRRDREKSGRQLSGIWKL